jgi:hypothetical protein
VVRLCLFTTLVNTFTQKKEENIIPALEVPNVVIGSIFSVARALLQNVEIR